MQVLTPNAETRKRVKQQRAAAIKLLCNDAPIAGVKMSTFHEHQGLECTQKDVALELQVTYTNRACVIRACVRAMCMRYTCVLCMRVCYISLLAMSPLQLCATGLEEILPLGKGERNREHCHHLRDLLWS